MAEPLTYSWLFFDDLRDTDKYGVVSHLAQNKSAFRQLLQEVNSYPISLTDLYDYDSVYGQS